MDRKNIVSIAALSVTSVAIIGVIGFYAWKNTQPLPAPIPLDMRPVEFAPTTVELDQDGQTVVINEARYALSGASMSESLAGFEPVNIETAFGSINIDAVNFVSNNAELSAGVSANPEWTEAYGDYDLARCVYVKYTTSAFREDVEFETNEAGEVSHPSFPFISISTTTAVDSVPVARYTVAIFNVDEDGEYVLDYYDLAENTTFYAIIPLQFNDENYNLVDIRDVSNSLILRLSSYGAINVTYEWLLGDETIADVSAMYQAYQEEIETNMTLATDPNVSSVDYAAVN
ncbi:MAG TPA: hypothetical protein PLQ04_04630 [Lachnospiraceae bacterium]|nr:hypothetical protein [Lachnospiraceae bacterium]